MYTESNQTVKEAVMNIKTVLSLNATEALHRRYKNLLKDVLENIRNKAFISALMCGLGFFAQFFVFALLFFLAAVYISNFNLGMEGSLEAIFLIIFAGYTAANHSKNLGDLSTIKLAAQKIFKII